jgi:hypothetical protein
VLREVEGWEASPYQWAAAGYAGAIGSGRTLCGALFGSTVYLGYLYGANAAQAPGIEDEARRRAILAVRRLYRGFVKDFGDTDCQALTGCDLSVKRDRARFYGEEVYRETCHRYFAHVLGFCLEQSSAMDGLAD